MAIRTSPGLSEQSIRRRQVPLAVLMVTLTTITLWSLGQAVVVQATGAVAPPQSVDAAAPAPRVADPPPT
jgi:hypothetical protein